MTQFKYVNLTLKNHEFILVNEICVCVYVHT